MPVAILTCAGTGDTVAVQFERVLDAADFRALFTGTGISCPGADVIEVATYLPDTMPGIEWVAENGGLAAQATGLGFLVALVPCAAVFGVRRLLELLR